MSSNSISWMVILSLFLGSCAQENQPTNVVPVLSVAGGRTQCLNRVNEIVDEYLSNALSDHQVNDFFNCVNDSIGTFAHYSKGEKPDGFSAQELRHFVENAFLRGQKISDQLLEQVMILKQFLVGGSKENLSRRELAQALDLLKMIRQTAKVARPFISQFLRPDRPEQITEGIAQIRASLERLTTYIAVNGRPYTLKNIANLIEAIQPANMQKWLSTLSLLSNLKSLFIRPPAHVLNAEDWPVLVDVALQGAESFLIFTRFVFTDVWYQERPLELANEQLKKVIAMVAGAISRQPNKMWLDRDLQNLLTDLQKSGWIGSVLSEQVIDQALPNLIHRVLVREKTRTQGLQAVHLAAIQKLWNQFFNESVADRKLIAVPGYAPLEVTEDGLWRIDALTPPRWSEKSIILYLVKKVIVECVFDRYAIANPSQMQADELSDFLANFSKLVEDVFEGTVAELTERIVVETSIFMPSSDGRKTLSKAEVIEYVHSLLSGMMAGGRVYATLRTDTRRYPGVGAFLNLVELAHQMTPTFWSQYRPLIERANSVDKSPKLDAAAYVKMWVLMQYIEVFFQRFDTNRNRVIEAPESLKAFEVYGPTVGEMLKGFDLGEAERKAFFTYLFAYGSTPFDEVAGPLRFLNWSWRPDSWSFKADRIRLAQTLARLAELQ